ncbi:hypothetical protein [Neptunomonas qingdaonensis]|uniref:Uncharacterized protein n=1 Tax=Neptunomonas qingdaonensis TaxID=1045558 RepID=A0A1I2U0B9_9GAMM|nr:hypothetical protein [Neptunomonas qingdaonensis]SFG68346.1 hypothetical protein SAMN05216175_11118 [Neptunomonas qingdaonensis]
MKHTSETGNVIAFPKQIDFERNQRLEKNEKQSERMAQLHSAGEEAFNNLMDWRKKIPLEDRATLAMNMWGILSYYDIKPRTLWSHAWEAYPDKHAFRRDLSRMTQRNPESATSKCFIANTATWIRTLRSVHQYLEASSRGISLESLADKLARGTRFHPLKGSISDQGKLRYLLSAITEKVNEETGLLSTYRKLAESKAEHLRRYYREIGESGFSMDYPDMETIRYFAKQIELTGFERHEELYNKPFKTFSTNDWNLFFSSIDEKEQPVCKHLKWELQTWNRMIEKQTTLVRRNMEADYSIAFDLYYLPRFFIGYHLHSAVERIVHPNDSELSYLFENCIDSKGLCRPDDISLGPDQLKHPSERPDVHHFGETYLVLYPDTDLSKIIPYVFYYAEEVSQFFPYEESPFDEDFFCQRFEKGEAAIGKTILETIEESVEEVIQSFRETAPFLNQHPYIAWKGQKEKKLDEHLRALLGDEHHSRTEV